MNNIIWRGVQLVIRLGSRVLVRLLSRLTVEGRENFSAILPGPLLIISNHKSYFDPLIIAAALPFFSRFNPLRFIAKDEFFQRPLSAFIFKLMGAFPARQGQGIDKSLETPEKILRENGTVVFFPEGSCVREDRLGDPKIGAAMLAKSLPLVEILPVAILGSYKIGTWRPKVKIKVGKPFFYKNVVTQDCPMEEVARTLFNEVASLYGIVIKTPVLKAEQVISR